MVELILNNGSTDIRFITNATPLYTVGTKGLNTTINYGIVFTSIPAVFICRQGSSAQIAVEVSIYSIGISSFELGFGSSESNRKIGIRWLAIGS